MGIISKKIKDLLAHVNKSFKESDEETISYQDTKLDAKFENQLHTLFLHMKDNSNKFLSKLVKNEVLALTSGPPSTEDHIETKFQVSISPSDQSLKNNKKN